MSAFPVFLVPGLIWFCSGYLVTTTGFIVDQLIMLDEKEQQTVGVIIQ